MLFDKNDDSPNERILYKTKPNVLFGCKKAIYGFILLVIVLMVSPGIIKSIGEMQVYLISYVNLSLTRYSAIAFFVVILIIIIYIIWQLVGWYSKEYTLTETRVIVKSGVLSTKKNYMPYSAIQDINTNQSIIGRLFKVGTISLFSAYDNNQMELSSVYNPSEAEEIIFQHMVNSRNAFASPQGYPNHMFERDIQSNDYYDEFEPITPIGRERDNYSRRDYDYYPEDLGYNEERYNRYEYEPYGDKLHAGNRKYDDSIRYEGAPGSYSEDSYYTRVREDYSYGMDNQYQGNGPEMQHDGGTNKFQNDDSDGTEFTSEKAIRRHFDKFKK